MNEHVKLRTDTRPAEDKSSQDRNLEWYAKLLDLNFKKIKKIYKYIYIYIILIIIIVKIRFFFR